MSKTVSKRKARPKATARADQLRPLNLPMPVEVELDDAGLPTAVSDFCTSAAPAPLQQDGEAGVQGCRDAEARKGGSSAIESILETWHVDDEWWRESISRKYVEVILEGGKHVVLYEDLTTSDWYMQRP